MLTMLLSACSIGPKSAPAEIAALPRAEVQIPEPPGRVLSYLSAKPTPEDADHPRVIFIHGTPGDATAFADYLVSPIQGVQAVSVDRLGFGTSISKLDASGKPVSTVVRSYEEQAAAIAPLLVEQGGRWPIVVGHSLGGPIAAKLAAMYPDKVSALVILAGSLDPELEDWKWYNELSSWAVLNWMLPKVMLRANQEQRAAKEQEELLAPQLADVRCPVVVVQGINDDLVPPGNAEYARRMFTGARHVDIVILKREGHFLPWRQEALIRTIIHGLAQAPVESPPRFGNEASAAPATSEPARDGGE